MKWVLWTGFSLPKRRSLSLPKKKKSLTKMRKKENSLTAMTYSKSKNLSAFLSKVSASAESVTGTPIDQLEKKAGITEILIGGIDYDH